MTTSEAKQHNATGAKLRIHFLINSAQSAAKGLQGCAQTAVME